MTTGIIHDQNLEKHIEKQMGCMAGFFQRFDRNHILTGKRLYDTKRLPPTAAVDSLDSVGSPAVSIELEKPQQTRAMTSPSPDRLKVSPVTEMKSPTASVVTPAKSQLPLPLFEFKEGNRSSWKFCKETPRLSLDSRAIVDAKGSLYPKEIRTNTAIISANRCDDSEDGADGDDKRRSPSVIARLMGLEQLPHSNPEPMMKAELRRSASESRVSKDLFQYRFIDGSYVQQKQSNQSHFVGGNTNISSNVIRDNGGIENSKASFNVRSANPMKYCRRNAKSEPQNPPYRGGVGISPWKSPQQRKSFFDSEDSFPEPKQTMSVYREIEKRLKMRGIDEPSKDLETLKQILEALQLKGLLHSKPPEQIRHRNLAYEREESPIVVMKTSRSQILPINRRFGNDSPPATFRNRAGVRRNLSNIGETSPEIDRNVRNQGKARNSSSPARRRSLVVETQRKTNEFSAQRRVSSLHSPKLSPKSIGSNPTVTTRSPRNRKPTTEIDQKEKIAIFVEDESSSISESSVSTSSQTDTEKWKMEEYKEGRSLLERCDKLLHSIMEITAATELQPSPVSVLDSSFYKDESSSPSPVMKRSIDCKDFEEEIWSPAISPIQSKCECKSDDCDFLYISDVLRASNYLPEDCDIFLLLEKQQYLQGKDTSEVSSLQRKLIFDTITEILNRNRQLPPWKLVSCSNSSVAKPSLRQIWSEFQRIRERDNAEELCDIICSVLRKDLAGDGINGWGDCPVEMSEAVLDIERLIFKDLIGETIRDLAAFAGNNNVVSAPRRRLVF
ncbi:hypothetical protein HYC85_031320 [Camellia sinensis]|uniref:DUF4378 domain-containing protein n=1 Tax=Camellia sinensis TaxID=4442 RepID=A0A7J7FQZ5_CAMSI|nr:hypothetical protein HYC85_031320 [Camellia sinensis]